MVYTANYTASDLSSIIFQGIGVIGATLASFAVLCFFVIVYKYVKKYY